MVPAFNSSFAFFQIFMGERNYVVQARSRNGASLIDVFSRFDLPDLPDLLASHQYGLRLDLLHLGLRIRLFSGCLLQSRPILRKPHEPWSLGHGVKTHGGMLRSSGSAMSEHEADCEN